MLFDTHAHLDDQMFDQDRHEIITKAYQDSVTNIINASSDIPTLKTTSALAKTYNFIHPAFGIHPQSAKDMNESILEEVYNLAKNEKAVAIGEIGLDYYYETSSLKLQKYWLIRQLDIAKELKLPVIIHDRDAHLDILEIIKKETVKLVGGSMHCFSGSVEMANELLGHNFYIGVGGPLTYKNAKKAAEVVAAMPMDRLLIETDSPYLPPTPHRGERNDPSKVRLVAEKIAEIRGSTFEEVANVTNENARRLFHV